MTALMKEKFHCKEILSLKSQQNYKQINSQILMKANFDLQKAEFSDSNSDQIQMHSDWSSHKYDKQYSYIFQEAKKFFAECKDGISRLMALNNIGFGFNLPFIFSTILAVQNKAISSYKNNSQKSSSHKKNKQVYFQSFYQILHRMSQLVNDLINLQCSIKKNYLRANIQVQIEKKHKQFKGQNKNKNKNNQIGQFQKNVDIKKSIIQQQERLQNQKQEKIRSILIRNNNHGPIPQSFSVCKKQASTLQNMERLQNKLDIMTNKLAQQLQKQRKNMQNFKTKKIATNKQKQSKQTQANRGYRTKSILSNTLTFQADQNQNQYQCQYQYQYQYQYQDDEHSERTTSTLRKRKNTELTHILNSQLLNL